MTTQCSRPMRLSTWGQRIWLAALLMLAACDKPQHNDLESLLFERNYSALEARLSAVQEGYASGAISEIELRNQYRAFYQLTPRLEAAFDSWVLARPDSYYAALARGYHHRNKAIVARGSGLAASLSREQVEFVTESLRKAEVDLRRSLALHPKPLMSVFGLLDVAGLPCKKSELREFFDRGMVFAPTSSLLHNRFIHYAKPRWQGSYSEMTAFIRRAVAAGLPTSAVLQLEAIVEDDMGLSASESGQKTEAINHLSRAAGLAQKVGGTFQQEWLGAVERYRCQWPELKEFCR